MNWKHLISTDNKNVSLGRIGIWLCVILILFFSIKYVYFDMTNDMFLNLINLWKNLLLIFVGYRGGSKAVYKITDKFKNSKTNKN